MSTPTSDPDTIDAKTAYEQLCTDFRSLNAILWQAPAFFTTLTGGLWYVASSFHVSPDVQSWILRFVATANVLMIVALWRLRLVMNGLFTTIQTYDGRPTSGRRYVIVSCFSLLLACAAIGSTIASFQPTDFLVGATSQNCKP